MLELILLRHAAAMSSAADGTDAGRPLSTTGDDEARAAGGWLAAHRAAPERVLCSPAARTMMTARHVLDALPDAPRMHIEPDIYEAAPGDLIRLLDRHADATRILLVGHNPGLEQLVGLLVEGRSGGGRGMPPAGIAWLHVDGPLEPGNATLHAFWSP